LAAKPVPAIASALIVRAEFPVEERVSVCVAAVFTLTLPNEMPDELTVSLAAEAISCSENVVAAPPVLAVSVAASVELTGDTFAVKLALLAPAATVTEAGTLTSELLLDRPIANPPLAAGVFTVTVQLSVPDPVIELLVQLSAVRPGTPVPLRPTTIELPFEELLAIDSCPACTPAAVGSNSTLNVNVWPGDSVAGRPSPGIEKPVPVSDALLTVTGMVPVEERTRGCVAAEPTETLPKVTLAALIPRIAVAASS
jgi:hypothetical protein